MLRFIGLKRPEIFDSRFTIGSLQLNPGINLFTEKIRSKISRFDQVTSGVSNNNFIGSASTSIQIEDIGKKAVEGNGHGNQAIKERMSADPTTLAIPRVDSNFARSSTWNKKTLWGNTAEKIP